MKKHLFATSAIVAAGVAMTMTPQNAAAQDDGGISLGVGGYYEFYYTATEQDEPSGATSDFRSDRVRSEGEIEFAGDAQLDNGITVGINVQLEAYTRSGANHDSADQIDEHYAFVDGSFGRFQIGAENSAAYLMHYASPNVGIAANSPDYLPFQSFTGITPSTYAGVPLGGGSGDANKLTYFTPRFAGFQLGVSYAPDTVDTGGQSQGSGLITDDANTGPGDASRGRAYGVGANFVRSFNGIDVAASGTYELVDDDDANSQVIGGQLTNLDEDYESYSFGLNAGYAGFTVGGSFNQSEDDGPAGGEAEATAYDLGVSYSTGPWGASLAWIRTELEADNVNAEPTQDSAVASLTYGLGPGITANANVHYFAEDVDTATGYDDDGYAGSVGLMLNF